MITFVDKYDSFDEFMGIIEDIRVKRYHFFELTGRQAHAFAVPVFRNKKIVMALAVIIPDFRFEFREKKLNS